MRDEDFSCSLDVLYEGQGISKLLVPPWILQHVLDQLVLLRLQVNLLLCSVQSCGSGSVWFWASWIRIRHYFVRIQILSTRKQVRKTLVSTILWLHFYFLSLRFDINVPLKKQLAAKKLFLQTCQSMTKKAGSESWSISRCTDPRIRIGTKMLWIHNTGSIHF
jgi:hypothetical protein